MSHSVTTNARRPSHLALYELLRERIGSSQHAIGSLLPPEEQLQTDLGHSRYAVRQALRQLEEEGMISRRRGVGTTVLSRTPVHTYRHVVGSREDLLSYAHTTRIAWSKSSFVQTDGALARQLGCDEARQWQKLHGIRYEEDGAVLCLVDLYVDIARATVGDERLFDGGPVYEWLEKHFNLTPHGLSQDIQAKSLTPNEAKLLNDQPGVSSLQIVRRYFDAGNQIYLISVNTYRSRDFVYNLRLHLR